MPLRDTPQFAHRLVFRWGMNVVSLFVTAAIQPGFAIDSWRAVFAAGLILTPINAIITNLLIINHEDSFQEALIQRLAKRLCLGVNAVARA
jgi:hypothetical protein